jgi:hypothetical protein
MEVTMPSWLASLLQSGAVWTAFIALVNVLVKYFAPSMPAEILLAINALIVVILAALGVQVNQALKAK